MISENVDRNIIPGLTKTLEKYILVYNTDSLIKQVNNSAKKVIRMAAQGAATIGVGLATALIAKELGNARVKMTGKSLKLEQMTGPPPGTDPRAQYYTAKKKLQMQQAAQQKDREYNQKVASNVGNKLQSISSNAGVRGIITPKLDQLTLEPTWVQVSTDSGTKLLGVKVVPYIIKTESMVGLLLNDKALKTIPAIASKYGRMTIRILSRAWQKLKVVVPGIHNTTVTGDAKNDIVWANTQYKKDLFVCLSQLDIEQTDFQATPNMMSKLNQLGWASMIFADDVNKTAKFCMKEFGGVCSELPYSHMYASFGLAHGKVYTDLEDAKKATGPFFRNKSTTLRKIFS